MANPVFSNDPVFNGKGSTMTAPPGGYYPAGSQTTNQPYSPGYAPTPGQLQDMYNSPSATVRDTGRLTYDDVIMKTAGMFGIVLVGAVVGWQMTPSFPWLVWAGLGVGLVLGLINAFMRQPKPALIVAYSAAEGVFLGGISLLYNTMWDGVVTSAILATFGTFLAALFLYKSGRVRVTAKGTRFLLIALGGYALFSLINLGLVWFNVLPGWGMRNGTMGLLIGLFAVGLAAYSLIVDFDAIDRGVKLGAPRSYAWTAAFGLLVTLIWLYLEFLRLFAILNSNR